MSTIEDDSDDRESSTSSRLAVFLVGVTSCMVLFTYCLTSLYVMLGPAPAGQRQHAQPAPITQPVRAAAAPASPASHGPVQSATAGPAAGGQIPAPVATSQQATSVQVSGAPSVSGQFSGGAPPMLPGTVLGPSPTLPAATSAPTPAPQQLASLADAPPRIINAPQPPAAPAVAPEALKREPALGVTAGSGVPFRDHIPSGAACPRCPELVLVPAGKFMFGAPPGDSWQEDWQKDAEGPLTPVTIAQPFAVSRYAISFDEWDACTDDGGCAGFKPDDNGWGRGNRPVINVSWENASAYIAWLSKKTGKSYRLLSEAEREYVTRAGTTTAFWFGASLSPKQAHYLQGANENVNSIFRERPAPVNAFEANPWGLYNVHGNVWDWTADCWNANHAGHPGDGSPRTTGDCSHRVLKGGSWLNLPKFVRAAARNRVSGHFRYKTISFRVARTTAVPH